MPIEQQAPGLERIVHLGQKLEELANGFGGDSGPAEGPVWWHEGGAISSSATLARIDA
jgi:gluconolactonase